MPPFQQNVSRAALALGVVGELAFEGPLRAAPGWLATPEGSEGNNIVGRVLTYVDGATSSFPTTPDDPKDPKPAEVQAGGTGAFFGILMSPKSHVYQGLNFDGAEMVIPNGTIVQGLSMGQIIVPITGTVEPGMAVGYTTATGVVVVVADPEAVPAGVTLLEGAETKLWKSSTDSLAVISLTR